MTTRRAFVRTVGGAILGLPALAPAQRGAMRTIGFLCTASPGPWARRTAAFKAGLAETGFIEGRNVAIEYRWAESRYERLQALASELVERQVSLIAATGGTSAVTAAMAATSTIPIVFTLGNDPVKLKFVENLNRPGGNVTGVSIAFLELAPKLLEVLHELVPKASTAALLVDPGNPISGPESQLVLDAAQSRGLRLRILTARTDAEIDAAFDEIGRRNIDALLVGSDPTFDSRRERLVMLSARRRLPTLYFQRDFALAGGLASYGTDLDEAYRQAGSYAGKILAGANPALMPIVRPTKIELVINLKTAKALGLPIPQSLLLRADEVIQ